MRTVVFIGLVMIAEAHGKEAWSDKSVLSFAGVITIVAMFMDVMDFIAGMFR